MLGKIVSIVFFSLYNVYYYYYYYYYSIISFVMSAPRRGAIVDPLSITRKQYPEMTAFLNSKPSSYPFTRVKTPATVHVRKFVNYTGRYTMIQIH